MGKARAIKALLWPSLPVRGGMWEAFLSLGLEGVEPLGISLRKSRKWKIITSRVKLVINGKKLL